VKQEYLVHHYFVDEAGDLTLFNRRGKSARIEALQKAISRAKVNLSQLRRGLKKATQFRQIAQHYNFLYDTSAPAEGGWATLFFGVCADSWCVVKQS